MRWKKLKEVIVNHETKERLEEEIGDLLLHGCFSLCLFMNVNSHNAILNAIKKYAKPFFYLSKTNSVRTLI